MEKTELLGGKLDQWLLRIGGKSRDLVQRGVSKVWGGAILKFCISIALIVT